MLTTHQQTILGALAGKGWCQRHVLSQCFKRGIRPKTWEVLADAGLIEFGLLGTVRSTEKYKLPSVDERDMRTLKRLVGKYGKDVVACLVEGEMLDGGPVPLPNCVQVIHNEMREIIERFNSV